MIDGESVLAFVPARGGSKRLPQKNLRRLGGEPLVGWTIAAAQNSDLIDRIVISTDDDEIMLLGEKLGCDVPFRRPAVLATDTARTIHVLQHLLRSIDREYTYVVQLQPTSPFRNSADIDATIEACVTSKAPACVSVCPVKKSPHWIFSVSEDKRMSPVLPLPEGTSRSQDLATYYELNGAIYVARSDWIVQRDSFLSDQTIAYVMPRERSLDIDTEGDLALAEAMIANSPNLANHLKH